MSSSKNDNKNNIKYIKSQFILEEKSIPIKNINLFKKSNLTTQTIIKTIFKKFNLKYNIMPKRYYSIIIDNIVFNEKSHIVSIFKDLLINYDSNDFLKRFYTKSESDIRLPKYFEYYDLYSKIFPNYTSIPEGKYFYINIQKKQRMIDLQENLENEKSMEKKMKKPKKKEKDVNVFNTSVINSILNRTNKEEMEIIFDLNLDDYNKEENDFLNKVNKLVDNINNYEVKEDYYIDYNFESQKEKKNNKKEIISPLMNININYINFNKFNDVKTNSISFNNQNNKNNNNNNAFLYKIFNMSIKDSKRNLKNQIKNKNTYKEGNLILMKINQIKQNKKPLQNVSNYLKNVNNNNNANKVLLSVSKNITSSMGKNNSTTNIKIDQKNKTIVYDYKNKNYDITNNIKIEKGNMNLKNIFTYRTSFGYLSPNNNRNYNNLEIPQKFPLSSRNKNNDIERNNINMYLTNNKYFNQKQNKSIQNINNNNKSTLQKKDNNLYLLINNSRNKILLNNKNQINPSSMSQKKFLNARSNYTPLNNRFTLKQKKKLKRDYSLLNSKFISRDRIWNIENKNNNTIFKDNLAFNNFVNDENINNIADNKNINKNSIFNNKTNYIKTKKMYHNNSSRNLNIEKINKRIKNKRDMSGIYMNEFIKAFNNSKNLRNKFLSLRNNEK